MAHDQDKVEELLLEDGVQLDVIEEAAPVAGGLGQLEELELAVNIELPQEQNVGEAFNVVKSLENVLAVQNSLAAMEENLIKVIDAMSTNRSIFSKWADWWGNMSLITKIASGALVVAPTLIAGLAASIPGLVIVSGGSAVLYSGTGLLLSDHHTHAENNKIQLKEGVIGLVSLFGQVINALEQLRHKLAVEVDRLGAENTKLSMNIELLHAKVGDLTNQVEAMAVQVEAQKASNVELRTLTEELKETEASLTEKVEQSAEMSVKLSGILNSMVTMQSKGAEQHEAFEAKIKSMITEKDQAFITIADRLGKTEGALNELHGQLNARNRDYARLNQDHKALVQRLERVLSHPAVRALELDQKQAQTPGAFGIFGGVDATSTTKEPEYRTEISVGAL